MANEELIAGIKKHLESGDSKEVIREHVLEAGYTTEEFEAAFAAAHGESASTAEAAYADAVDSQLQTGVNAGATTAATAVTATPSEPSPGARGDGSLPRVVDFFAIALRFGFTRLDLIGWGMFVQLLSLLFLAPLLVPLVVDGANFLFFLTPFLLLGVAALSILNTASLMYAAVSPEHTSYGQGFAWARSRFWSYLWIHILMSLVVAGGLMLFIIPGIIIMVWFATSAVVLAREDLRGRQALLRSKQLVRGHWWGVFGLLLPMFAFFFLLDVLFSLLGFVSDWVSGLLALPMSIIVSLVVSKALAQIYDARAAIVPQQPTPESKSWIVIIAVIGAIIILFGIFGSVILGSLDSARDTSADARAMQTLSHIRSSAEIMGHQEDGTVDFSEVCNLARSLAADLTNFKCNDSVDAYAFEAATIDGYICTDSTGYSEESGESVLSGTQCGTRSTAPDTDKNTDAVAIQTFSNLRASAEIYAYKQDGTINYRDVCDALAVYTEDIDKFVCNDSADAYAFEATLTEGYYCADSSGYSKERDVPVLVGTRCGSTNSGRELDDPVSSEAESMSNEDATTETTADVERKERVEQLVRLSEGYLSGSGSTEDFCEAALQAGFLQLDGNDSLEVSCDASDQQFRLLTTLSDGTFYCADDTGFLGELATAPSGLQCSTVGGDSAEELGMETISGS